MLTLISPFQLPSAPVVEIFGALDGVAKPPICQYYWSMEKVARGLYRTTGWAYVTDETIGFDVPEQQYRAKGYKPDYDQLPSKDAYDAAEAKKSSAAPQGGGR